MRRNNFRSSHKYKINRLNRKDWKGLITILFLLIIVLLFIIYYINISQKIVKIDEEFCPENISVVSVVLIDQTDTFNVFQKTSIHNVVKDIIENLSIYERIEIFFLNPIDNELLTPIFAICNPGRGENENRFSGNKELKSYNWNKNFYKPFSHALNKHLKENEANVSPIMEAIQSIALTTFHKYKNAEIKFYIFSDMLQHSTNYSNYALGCDFNIFQSSKAYNRLIVDINNVDIQIYYINRDVNLQGKKHILFWEQYFNSMGGILSYVKKVEG